MKTVKDIFFIDADFNANKTMAIKDSKGEGLYIDIDFDPYSYATRIGTITHTPLLVRDKYASLKKGDTVIFHHFVCQEDNRVVVDDKEYFKADYFHIYAKVEDGKVYPLDNFIFVEPIKEDNLFVGNLQVKFGDDNNKRATGRIKFLSDDAKELGLREGDKVFYTRNAEYKMNVVGLDLFRMRIRNILLVERDGELVCLNDRLLLKSLKKEGMWVTGDEKGLKAKVFGIGSGEEDIEVGDIIGYSRGLDYPIEYGGTEYLLIRRENANYVL